jgi:hypothetical protein
MHFIKRLTTLFKKAGSQKPQSPGKDTPKRYDGYTLASSKIFIPSYEKTLDDSPTNFEVQVVKVGNDKNYRVTIDLDSLIYSSYKIMNNFSSHIKPYSETECRMLHVVFKNLYEFFSEVEQQHRTGDFF